jgi:SOS response regulatory protein OraA/RecX
MMPDATTLKECSPAAERMRRHRQRRTKGLRCLMVELREAEIDALIRLGLLPRDSRTEQSAVRKALYALLDRTLGRPA